MHYFALLLYMCMGSRGGSYTGGVYGVPGRVVHRGCVWGPGEGRTQGVCMGSFLWETSRYTGGVYGVPGRVVHRGCVWGLGEGRTQGVCTRHLLDIPSPL
jgi:hypothetical protein